MNRTPATLYSTWLQQAMRDKPITYFIVIQVTIHQGKPYKLTLLNLDGSLKSKEVTVEQFNKLEEARILVQWKPIPPTRCQG